MKTKGIYFVYRFLQALSLPALCAYLLFRSVRNPAYFKSLPQRFGFLSRSYRQTVPGAIWLHAVSVGEVLSTEPLARRLRAEFPRSPLFLSTSTLAGDALARERLGDVANHIFFAPIDLAFAIRRVLRTLRPFLMIVVETEIWPNLFREVKRIHCGLVIVNGRISDRTEGSYRRFRWFFSEVLHWPDAVLVQNDLMRERYLAIGAPAGRLQVTGNLKYDSIPRELEPDSPLRTYIERLNPAEVWIAASTMPPMSDDDIDEDDAVIAAFRDIALRRPGLLLVLAPRKPERFDVVAAKLQKAGIRFTRRSKLEKPLELPGILLLDSIGELGGLFVLADVVFMGGTLAARGGHNILEPAHFSVPIICGPHMENFRDIANAFRKRQAFVEIQGPGDLANAVIALLEDRQRAAELGRRAGACAESERGATVRALEAIQMVAAESWPKFRAHLPALIFLWPFSLLWRTGAAWNRHLSSKRRRALDVPVLSVGNITVGGTGKTPFVLYLAELLRSAGHKPGILSRGHGRHSLEQHLILEPGARVKVSRSGDEPQIFLRSGVAPVGIGKDRFRNGRLLEERFGVDVLILDDGFQHVQLERQLDVVLIDALLPFGGGALVPLGRLREPLQALARADAIVMTRVDCCRAESSLERRLRRYNTHAPIFRAHTVPESWVDAASGNEISAAEPPFTRAGAFCGLGNPESFWCILDLMGIRRVDSVEFSDHHKYWPREVQRLRDHFLASKADAIVTTEKDSINLCEGWRELLAPLPLYWLKIGIHVEEEAALAELIRSRLVFGGEDFKTSSALQ